MTLGDVAIVVAVARNGIIGRAGGLPWRIPEDLRRFKAITMGHAIIMGRKTHESIGRPLVGRRNIVVTRDLSRVFEGCELAPTFEAAVSLAHTSDPMPMVIGGGELYRAALPRATRLYLTRLEWDAEGDVSFPEFDSAQWRESKREPGPPGVTFLELERIR